MLKNARNGHCALGLTHFGCSEHNSKTSRRREKHTAKRAEERRWKRETR